MDIELVVKLVALAVSAIGAWKVFAEQARTTHAALRDEHRFAKEFLAEVQSQSLMHPFVREKGYEAIAGARDMTSRKWNTFYHSLCPPSHYATTHPGDDTWSMRRPLGKSS